MKKQGKRYTAAERRAYYIGVGASIGYGKKIKKTLNSMTATEKESFHNGFDDRARKKDKILVR